MKAALALVVCLVSAASALAQHDHHATDAQASRKGQTHRGLGLVKSVNTAKLSVTIQHEPVVSLKWPGMTMAFKVHDRKTLEQLKPGAEVNFEFENRGKDYVITAVNPGWGSCSADCPMNRKH